MPDLLASLADSAAAPSRNPYPISPHDTNELPVLPKGIFIGTAGDVVLRGPDSAVDVTYRNLSDGSYIAVRAQYVRATGTTASNLIGEA